MFARRGIVSCACAALLMVPQMALALVDVLATCSMYQQFGDGTQAACTTVGTRDHVGAEVSTSRKPDQALIEGEVFASSSARNGDMTVVTTSFFVPRYRAVRGSGGATARAKTIDTITILSGTSGLADGSPVEIRIGGYVDFDLDTRVFGTVEGEYKSAATADYSFSASVKRGISEIGLFTGAQSAANGESVIGRSTAGVLFTAYVGESLDILFQVTINSGTGAEDYCCRVDRAYAEGRSSAHMLTSLVPRSAGIALLSVSGHDYTSLVPELGGGTLMLSGLAVLVLFHRKRTRGQALQVA